jgi:hypothetical protein
VSKVQKVARVLHEKLCAQDINGYLDANFDLFEVARAAIVALEEATNLMVEAAVLADPYSCDVDDHNLVYPKIWYAMVHAALAEERT